MPAACAMNGGNLVIMNLQSTPLDKFATLVIHAKIDTIMELLMAKLDYQIPTWQLKKRIEVSLVDDGTKIQLRGVDETRQPFHLFDKITVEGLGASKIFPSVNQKKQPYRFVLPEADRPETISTTLKFMGHYQE